MRIMRRAGLVGVVVAVLVVFGVVSWSILSTADPSDQAEPPAYPDISTVPWDEESVTESRAPSAPTAQSSPTAATSTPGTSSPATNRRPAAASGSSSRPVSTTQATSRTRSSAPAASTPRSASTTQTTGSSARQSTASTAQRVLSLVNAERTKRGLRALTLHSCLTTKVSQPWAQHMASTGSFAHQELAPIWSTCSGLGALAENIAVGQRTPEAVVSAWMASSGHRANILNPQYTRLGVGIATNGGGTPYWVQNFAS